MLAPGVRPTGTCVNIEVTRERLIRTLNDIQLNKSGGSLVLTLVAGLGVHKRLLASRRTRVRRLTSAQTAMEQILRDIALQVVSTNLCVRG